MWKFQNPKIQHQKFKNYLDSLNRRMGMTEESVTLNNGEQKLSNMKDKKKNIEKMWPELQEPTGSYQKV